MAVLSGLAYAVCGVRWVSLEADMDPDNIKCVVDFEIETMLEQVGLLILLVYSSTHYMWGGV